MFDATTEQADLRATVRAFLARHAAPLRAREPGTLDGPLWKRLAGELGLTALAVPDEAVELAIVLEEAGRALLPAPYLSTVVAAGFAPAADRPGLAAGTTVAALALGPGVTARDDRLDGVMEAVPDSDIADLAIVAASGALFAVGLAGVDRTGMSTLDQTRPVARLSFRDSPAVRVPGTPEQAMDALHIALAVESVGAAAANLELTLAYLKTRHQFGAPLASFQALRHRVADLYAQLEAARSSAWYAVRAPAGERPVVAPLAKLVAAEAAYEIAAEGIQLHGGIGFTWEHDAHRYFKRATVGRLTQGDPVELRRLIGTRAGLTARLAPSSPSP